MQIFVQALGGNHYCLEFNDSSGCCPRATAVAVSSVKSLVQARSGVPSDLQRLTHGGRELCNDNLLADYGIEHGSTVRMTLRLRGGKDLSIPAALTRKATAVQFICDLRLYQHRVAQIHFIRRITPSGEIYFLPLPSQSDSASGAWTRLIEKTLSTFPFYTISCSNEDSLLSKEMY